MGLLRIASPAGRHLATRVGRSRSIAVALLVLGAAGAPPAGGDGALVVRYASLETRERPWGGGRRRETTFRTDVEFEERRLRDLQDDETDMEIAVVDARGHGAHHDVTDLEDCRMDGDTTMTCRGGPVFRRVRAEPPRWRVVLEFTRPSRAPSDGFHGPVTVRFSYLYNGERVVHGGVIDRCSPTRGGPKLVCKARRWTPAPASVGRSGGSR